MEKCNIEPTVLFSSSYLAWFNSCTKFNFPRHTFKQVVCYMRIKYEPAHIIIFISYHISNAKIVVATLKYTGVARMSIGKGTRFFFSKQG